MSLYLGLGYYDPEAYDKLSVAERQTLGERCRPHDEKFGATGKVRDVGSLDHGTWAHIRPTESGPSVTDGPFAEAKEVVGSYFIIEADSFEEAVEILSLHPASQIGWEVGFSMEVR
ncbi:MAG: YciI family protein, partial [Gemmatimonadota bacterium]